MIRRKCYIVYPCGKKFEIRVPLVAADINGNLYSILPGADNYFELASKKFAINNLKVIEEEVLDNLSNQYPSFISISKKIRCVE